MFAIFFQRFTSLPLFLVNKVFVLLNENLHSDTDGNLAALLCGSMVTAGL